MINNSINFMSGYNPATTKKTKNDKDVNQNQEVNQPKVEDEEDNSFEATARKSREEDAKFYRNLVTRSLLALSLISSPFVISNLMEENDFEGSVPAHMNISEDDQKLLDKAALLSKDGKDSTVLEADEFYQLLNYSSLNDIPRLNRENIKVNAAAGYIPIDMKSNKSDEEILKQVKDTQHIIDYIAKRYKEDPPKTSTDIYADYVVNNVTDEEILREVDFSELEQYQPDLTGVKNSINMTRERIRRDDAKAAEKEEKAIKDAQRFVNAIVERYKTRAKVSGNYDGNTELSKYELAGLLNSENIKDLPVMWQIQIINKALEDYNPRDLAYVERNEDVERENERVDKDRQKAQAKLDALSLRAQTELFHVLHPNEIPVRKKD